MRKILITLSLAVFTAVALSGAVADEFTETDNFTIPAGGVNAVDLENLSHADFSYKGDDALETFTVHFERKVKGVDQEEFDEMLEHLNLDVVSEGGKVVFELIHPKNTSSGLFKRLFDRKEWRVKLEITGPSKVDMDIDSDFSKVRTNATIGKMTLNTDFGDARINNHSGRLVADVEFGSIHCENLDGSFDVDSSFESVDIRMKALRADSQVNASFGNVKIDIPKGSGVDFHVEKSFGGVKFRTSADVESSDDGRVRMINGGGPEISLDVEFGDITVRDNVMDGEIVDVRMKATDRKDLPKREPKPKFEEGIVSSIKISGTYLLEDSQVSDLLDVKQGERYTRDEINEKVKALAGKHKFIRYTNFSISTDGNLRVRVFEVEAHKKDFDLSASFSRVGGVGLGPKLTINSVIGPVSKIEAAGEYHFSNSEWTYHASAEKSLLNKIFAIGGAYRLDYESSMDWAIPKDDSNLNALLLGLETKNFYQVEGTTGFIRLAPLDWINIKAEYFEDKFSSVKKNTNWSVFNHRHIKDDNLPLAEMDENRYVGARARIEMSSKSRFSNGAVILEAERTIDKAHNSAGEFSRYLLNAYSTWRLSRDNFLKVRLAGGYSNDALPAYKAFNLGGNNTLRGYEYQSIPGGYPFDFQYGGNRMALCNIEYFIGDNDDMGFVIFADAGNVWMKGQEANFDSIKRDVGIGLTFDFVINELPAIENDVDGFRVNWAVPVGNVPHVSNWTVSFVQSF